MDRYPLITVLTLSYNSTYIYESIQSVLEQSYPHIEYIIVDDGSGVFCQDEIRTYIKNRKGNNLEDYQVIVHPQNLGTVKASNTGLVHSHGEYILTWRQTMYFLIRMF